MARSDPAKSLRPFDQEMEHFERERPPKRRVQCRSDEFRSGASSELT
jgi:hypothetical protein